jgi:hypothetical protein
MFEEAVGDGKPVEGLRRGWEDGHAGEYTTTWIRCPREVLKGFLDSDQEVDGVDRLSIVRRVHADVDGCIPQIVIDVSSNLVM